MLFTPLFSIITICFNEENRIRKTIESVCAQTCPDFEHIIEDGNSSDNTLSIIDRSRHLYSDDQLRIYSEADDGLYDAMNRALKRVRGKYICFLNSGDTFYDKNVLEHTKSIISSTPNMDWYYGDSVVVFPNHNEYCQVISSYENLSGVCDLNSISNMKINLIHQSIFAAKHCFDNNYFDTRYKLRAELNWYYCCFLRGCKVKKLNFLVSKYLYGGISERIDSIKVDREETLRILMEHDILTEEKKHELTSDDWMVSVKKDVFDRWLAIRQAGMTLEMYFKNKGMSRIAIYGYGDIGTHLINELKNSNIKICGIIDREFRYPYNNIPVYHIQDFYEDVDAIVVCAITHFNEIKEVITQYREVNIVSIEEVLEETWMYSV